MKRILATLLLSLGSTIGNAHASVAAELDAAQACLRLVDDRYRAVAAELAANEDHGAIGLLETYGRSIDRQQCHAVIQRRQAAALAEATERLQAAVRFYRDGQPLSEGERAVVEREFEALGRLPASPAYERYRKLYAEYRDYASSAARIDVVELKTGEVYRCVNERGETTFSQAPCITVVKKIRAPFSAGATSSASACREFDRSVEQAGRAYAEEVTRLPRSGAADPDFDWQAPEQRRLGHLSGIMEARIAAARAGCAVAGQKEPAPAQRQDAARPLPRFAGVAYHSGRFQPAGRLFANRDGATYSLLPDGSLLQFGAGIAYDGRRPHVDFIALILERQRSLGQAGLSPEPMLWNPAQKKWKKLDLPPDCEARRRFLHTATVLRGGQVLIAGGMCVKALMRNEPRVAKAHTALSIWDAGSGAWQPGPHMAHSRIFHSATPMPDGSVLIVGGQADPLVEASIPRALQRTVDKYHEGRVTALDPMFSARAMHTATATRDGCLLVAGGYGTGERALAKAERWCPRDGRWQPLPDLATARFGHAAVLLEDGRILVVGGKDAAGNPLDTTELWNPRLARWQPGPRLPTPLFRSGAIRLGNGTVLVAGGALQTRAGAPAPWAWTWDTHSPNWLAAGLFTPSNDDDLIADVSLTALPGGEALFISPGEAMQWKPSGAGGAGNAPVWASSPPAATLLPDGRALAVGRVVSDPGSGHMAAYTWDPRGRRWQSAGTTGQRYHSAGDLVVTPAGEVVLVGETSNNFLLCERWTPRTGQWQPCGSIQAKFPMRGRIELGLLPDGRVFALPNASEALVLDPDFRRWAYWPIEWHTSDLGFGVPVVPKSNLAEITDPETGRAFEVNDAASRAMKRSGNNPATSLLWNPDKKHWSYVLQNKSMGVDALFLPDGCALSVNRNGIFNPATGRVSTIPDPGYGIDFEKAVVVFTDGGLLVTGVPQGAVDPGSGIFHGKASCDGVVPHGQADWYFTTDIEKWQDQFPVVQPKTIAEIEAARAEENVAQPSRPFESQVAAVLRFAHEYRRWLFAVLALAIVLKLLSMAEIPLIPPISTWLVRIPTYALVLAYVAPPLLSYFYTGSTQAASVFTTFRYSERACERDIRNCIDPSNGLLWAVGDHASEIPCYLVGEWSLKTGRKAYRIKLKEDGTYVMTAALDSRSRGNGYIGHWTVQGDDLVWRHHAGGGMDINRIVPESESRFQVIEMNGKTQTQFELIEPGNAQNCVS